MVAGRRDVAVAALDHARVAGARARVGDVGLVIASPALRCRETAAAIFPDDEPTTDTRLWEQNFGVWEGVAYSELPDLGPLSRRELAEHRPPGGESFLDVCQRVAPALQDLANVAEHRIAVVAHAGTIRAAIALSLGAAFETALAFEIEPLSVTLIRVLPGPAFSIGFVNCQG